MFFKYLHAITAVITLFTPLTYLYQTCRCHILSHQSITSAHYLPQSSLVITCTLFSIITPICDYPHQHLSSLPSLAVTLHTTIIWSHRSTCRYLCNPLLKCPTSACNTTDKNCHSITSTWRLLSSYSPVYIHSSTVINSFITFSTTGTNLTCIHHQFFAIHHEHTIRTLYLFFFFT